MINDYIYTTEKTFYKHVVSHSLSCDAYSMHTHNAYELIYFISGDATHVIEDRKYKLKAGDLILIRPFMYHFIQIDSPATYERYDLLFDAERHGVDGLSLIPPELEVINISGNLAAQDIFRRCDIYRESCDGETFSRILPHLLSELFFNVSIFSNKESSESSPLSPLITEALQYANENLCTLSDVKEIADALFVSESYLFRLFRKELHQTPRKYVTEKRLLMAQKMLASGEQPTDVCARCGFSDYTTFYRNYSAFFGHSPSKSGLNIEKIN